MKERDREERERARLFEISGAMPLILSAIIRCSQGDALRSACCVRRTVYTVSQNSGHWFLQAARHVVVDTSNINKKTFFFILSVFSDVDHYHNPKRYCESATVRRAGTGLPASHCGVF